jgi:Xaa-Pro aminopeptidase
MAREKLMNVERFQAALAASGLDAVVAVSLPNVFYTSGALVLTQIDIRDRLALTVLPRDGRETLIVCNIEASLSREESWIPDVRSYVEFSQSPIGSLAEVLTQKGLARGRIGIEKKYLASAYYDELVAALPGARFEACDELFDQVRSVKTAGEIEKLECAARSTEMAIAEAFRHTRPGQTERELLQALLDNVSGLGGSDVRLAVVAAGDHSAQTHARARSRKLQPGDLVRVRIVAVFDAYLSDVARTAVVGAPSAQQQAAYRANRAAQLRLAESIRPGVLAGEAYQVCVDAYGALGFDYDHPSVGRGVGWAGYELPILRLGSNLVLEQGMAICLDPVLLDPQRGGYQVADLAVVEATGVRMVIGQAENGDLPVIG